MYYLYLSFPSSRPNELLTLALSHNNVSVTAEEPITIGQMFRQTVSSYPDTPALGHKEGEEWKKNNYSEYNCIIKVNYMNYSNRQYYTVLA